MTHTILGAGISGLSAAYYLSKLGIKGIKIYESTNRVGGWIKSVRSKNGALFELGPKTIRYDGMVAENTLDLCNNIGLMPLIVPVEKSSPASKNRFIYCNKELVCLPNNLLSFFRIKPPYIKPFMHALWHDYKAPKKQVTDDSVYDFVARRFGEDYAAIPCSALVCGVFGGDSKEISVKAILKEAFEQEQKYGSVIRGAIISARTRKKPKKESLKWCAWSFKDGLETLPIHLHKYLTENKKAEVFLESNCSDVTFEDGKAVLTINGKKETADHLYSALPSIELGKILSSKFSFLKTELSAIPFVNVAVVNLEYEGDLLKQKGFGFLAPPNQNLPILGITFDSCIFPQSNKTILTVMMGGRWFEKYFGTDPEEKFLYQIAEENVQTILKINKDPINSKVTVLRNCIPQYVVGHTHRVQKIKEFIQQQKLPLTLLGNSYEGVGLNDAILSSKNQVENLFLEKKHAEEMTL